MTHLARIASLLYGRPLLVHPATAEVINTALGERFGAGELGDIGALLPDASRFRGTVTQESQGRYRTENGVAIVTIAGELCNRGAWIGASSGLTSYEGIVAQLRSATADPSIRAIVLDMNTPGGEAVGAFEAAARVKEAAAKKPVVAFVDGMAASAGYAIASGADRIVVTPSAIVGSIGVVMLHLDQSRRLDKAGVTPTFIFAGQHKVDGHALGPLPETVKADLQAEVERFYSLFVDTVATNRGMTAEAVRATEARCFMGADAVAAGLADETGTLDTILSSLNRPRTAPGSSGATATMTDIPRAEHETLLAAARKDAHDFGFKAGEASAQGAIAAARSEAASAERDRIGAILGSEEAKGREAQAQYLALETDMSAESARKFLAKAPAAPAPAQASRLSRTPNPPVGPDTAGAEPKANASAGWDSIIADMNVEKGFKPR